MTTTLERPREVPRDRDEFRDFLEAHDELDTLTDQVAHYDEGPSGPRRGRWLAAAFALVVLVLGAIVVALTVDFGATDTTGPAANDEEALARLADEGYVPGSDVHLYNMAPTDTVDVTGSDTHLYNLAPTDTVDVTGSDTHLYNLAPTNTVDVTGSDVHLQNLAPADTVDVTGSDVHLQNLAEEG